MHDTLAQYRFEGIFAFVCARFSKKVLISTFFLYPSTFYTKTPSFGGVIVNKNTKKMQKLILAKKNGKLSQKYIFNMSLEKLKLLSSSE